jgi:hypothetical protein
MKAAFLQVRLSDSFFYLDLILFIREKAASQRHVDPKNAGKQRSVNRTEAANKF